MAVIFTTKPPSFPRSHSTFFPLTDPPPNQSAEHGTSSVTAVGSGAFVEVGTEVQDGVNVGEVVTLGGRGALGVGGRGVGTGGGAGGPGGRPGRCGAGRRRQTGRPGERRGGSGRRPQGRAWAGRR